MQQLLAAVLLPQKEPHSSSLDVFSFTSVHSRFFQQAARFFSIKLGMNLRPALNRVDHMTQRFLMTQPDLEILERRRKSGISLNQRRLRSSCGMISSLQLWA